eukprot:gb/GECG01012646.1/.p1 GENE.gb/GECG01012646.1/~~gb/GECG01012646.1/.p1  ORF type:complete len:242 (+),score=30.45 gb/GECG01012646.1/:1-726(+)
MYAPAGSGKSCYVIACANELRQAGVHVVHVDGTHDVHTALTIPKNEKLKDCIPDKSLIIIDQAENIALDEQAKNYIRALATQSRNNRGKFNVVIAVSDKEKTKILVDLNGLDKIKGLARTDCLKWTQKEVTTFLQQSDKFNEIPEAQELGEMAAAPAFLEQMHKSPSVNMNCTQKAHEWQVGWNSFEEIDNTVGIAVYDEVHSKECDSGPNRYSDNALSQKPVSGNTFEYYYSAVRRHGML